MAAPGVLQTMLRALLIAVLSVAVLSVALPTPAWPCGNPVMLAGNKAVKKVRRAELLLERGKLDQARRAVGPYDVEFADPKLQRRANLVWATAMARLGHVDAAVDTLNQLLGEDDDPLLLARLAEALLRGDEEQAKQGAALIEDLAARDLVPDAYGWAALATARARRGDVENRDVALARCRKIAKRKSICRVASS